MKKPEKIRVLVADDHYIVWMGLIALVNTEPDMEVVGEAADGAQALELLGKCNPDLALLDLRMPVKDGIQTASEIRNKFPNAQVLMLTAFDGDKEIYRALQAGARGYVLKSSSGEKLIPALRAVAAGQQWLPKEVAIRLAARKKFEEITPREVQVLQQLAKGAQLTVSGVMPEMGWGGSRPDLFSGVGNSFIFSGTLIVLPATVVGDAITDDASRPTVRPRRVRPSSGAAWSAGRLEPLPA
jgi:DNA-binding NarL/FixJ family response regulator